MSLAALYKNKIVITKDGTENWHAPGLREFCSIPGVRSDSSNVLIPKDVRLVELFRQIDPTLKLDQRVQKWYSWAVTQEEKRTAWGLDEGAEANYATAKGLWPFQRAGVNFLVKNKRSLLCDEPGLGKTAQAVVAVMESGRSNRILVVCPNSLKGWWNEEIDRWTTTLLPITVIRASTRTQQMQRYRGELGWCIVNWELLRLMPQLRDVIWDWIVCDEAHRVKNRKTQVFGALNRLKSSRMALLTGTPLANHPAELWTLLHLVEPGKYTSYWRFFEMYVDYQVDFWGHRDIRGVRYPKLLRRELAPRMLRRSKEQCLPQLPAKAYKTIPLILSGRQELMYKGMAREMLVELEGGEVLEAPSVIAMITRLRQITSTTATIDETDHSAKLEAVMDIVNDFGEKVVVFAQFRNTVSALCRRLIRAGIPYSLVWGGMTPESVSEQVRNFQDGDSRVFVGTTEAGGVGLTLTAARTLVFIDKHWNPARQAQAEDRIHRIGQDNAVQIISLHCKGTVDDLVEDVLQKKLRMTAEILQPELVKHLKEVVK